MDGGEDGWVEGRRVKPPVSLIWTDLLIWSGLGVPGEGVGLSGAQDGPLVSLAELAARTQHTWVRPGHDRVCFERMYCKRGYAW